MDINIFLNQFAEQFDDTDASEITAEVEFKNLDEWDSLIALSVIVMVEKEYSVVINGDDIKAADTSNQLFEIIKSRK